MDVVQFQEKLREICDLGKQNGNLLTHEQIREHFASTDLETSQMVKVLQYLKLQGITIEGEENAAQAEEAAGEAEAQPNGTKTPLTPEEEAYLKEYLSEVSTGKEVSQEMVHTLFENLADGDALAEAALTSIYLPVAANMAADMNCAEIHLADLIQEANVALLNIFAGDMEGVTDSDIRDRLRKGVKEAANQQDEQKFEDDCLVAKVQNLDNVMKDLTDGDEGEPKFSVEELAIMLDMDIDEMKDIIRLTGSM